MNKDSYLIIQNEDHFYTFMSNGQNGDILKAVVFQPLNYPFYNLALLDYIPEKKAWDDMAISNNSDMPKIMATVLACLVEFLKLNPKSYISIAGNSPTKIKLYNRIVRNYQNEFQDELQIMVESMGELVPITLDKEYKIFYICKKVL